MVTNKSGVDLNVKLTIKRPFYLINEMEQFTEETTIKLNDRATVKVYVKFLPDMNNDDLYSKIHRGVLIIEYDEHPIKVT